MTEAQARFVELELKKDAIKKYYEDMEAALEALVKEQGVGSYFSDGNIVYKVIETEGKYVKFDKYSYVRTKREGEQRGSLSVKEAEEHGFKIK